MFLLIYLLEYFTQIKIWIYLIILKLFNNISINLAISVSDVTISNTMVVLLRIILDLLERDNRRQPLQEFKCL